MDKCLYYLTLGMNQPAYTSIPDTSDTAYWMLKSSRFKLQTFVPRDPELHKRLKTIAWEKIQARLEKKHRSKEFGGPSINS